MKQKYEGKDLQGLVDLGREQGYLTFDQVNDFLPQDVASPTDLRAALESFEDMDIKVLDEVPTDGGDDESKSRPRKSPRKRPRPGRRRFAQRIFRSGPPLSQGDGQLPAALARAGSRNRQAYRSRRERGRGRGPALAGDARFRDRSRRAYRGRRSRSARSVSSRKTKPIRMPIPTRSAVPRPTKSSSRSCSPPVKKLKSLRAKVEDTEDKLKDKPKGPNKTKLEKQFVKLKDERSRKNSPTSSSRATPRGGNRRDAPPAQGSARIAAR